MDLPVDPVLPPSGRAPVNDRVWFVDHDGWRLVYLCGIVLYRFSVEDAVSLRFVAVSLRLDGHVTQPEIAAAFCHSVRTQARWESIYRESGIHDLQDKKPTGRPRALDETMRALLVRWFRRGLSNREMARRFGVDESCVRREIKRLELVRPETVAFVEEDDDEEGKEVESEAREEEGDKPAPSVPYGTCDVDPRNRAIDRDLARQGLLNDAVPFFADAERLPKAGVLLAVPLLVTSGALGVFERLFGSLGPAFYGLRTTVVCLFLAALLRIKRPENLKEYDPAELGRIVGLDRMPEVKTLRRKLAALARAKKGEELMRALAKLRVEGDPELVGYLYVDGHTREYHGKHPLGKAHLTGRRISAPAATDNWLGDGRGDPLFLVTSELNASLTQALPGVLAEVREVVGEGRRVTVVFDRGGYSPRLFAELEAAGFDLLTYRKGKKDPVPTEEFVEAEVERKGKRETWRIHDKAAVPVGTRRPATETREAEPWVRMRQVSRLREDATGVTQVLTTREDVGAVEVLVRMFDRWRQENFFKYMLAEFALDALCEYGAEDLSAEADRPNPERRELEKARARAKARLEKLLAELGDEVEQNEESRRRTVRGLKIAKAELRREIAEVTAEVEGLTAEIRELPPRVRADQLKQLKRDRKLVVDAVKMLAYQVESDLHRMLSASYARAEDEGRTLLQAVFQSSARLEVGAKELTVTIARQSADHRTSALRHLCEEMNKLGVEFPGSDLRLVLQVESPEHAIG
jgi:transposase